MGYSLIRIWVSWAGGRTAAAAHWHAGTDPGRTDTDRAAAGRAGLFSPERTTFYPVSCLERPTLREERLCSIRKNNAPSLDGTVTFFPELYEPARPTAASGRVGRGRQIDAANQRISRRIGCDEPAGLSTTAGSSEVGLAA